MGKSVTNPTEAQQLDQAGWSKCRNPACDYWLDPDEFSEAEDNDHYFGCPKCKLLYRLVDPTPFHVSQGGITANPVETDFGEPIEGINRDYETIVGLTMKEQGDLGEEVVKDLKEIPGYGPITWWSETYNDPIDGGAGEWGIEVKTICIDAKNHRFVPGSTHRKEQIVARARELGFKGVLGLLVILDYRRSVSDIYAMEMSNDEWVTQAGRKVQGPVAYRKHNGQQLIAEVPFANPFLNPQSGEPEGYDLPF